MLEEVTQCADECIEASGTRISDILEQLYRKYPKLRDMEFRVAQDQEIVTEDSLVQAQELVLLPPFSGG